MSILAIGSVAYDDVKTPAANRKNLLGGSATYFCGVASFFHPVRLMATVGGDFLPRDEKILRRFGIDLAALAKVSGGKTFRWSGVYEKDMNIRRTTRLDLNVFADFSPRLSEEQSACRYLYLGNISPFLQDGVLSQLSRKRPRLVIGDTMDHWIKDCPAKVIKLVRKLDLLLINDMEARLLAKRTDLVASGRAIQKIGVKNVIIKRGEHGATIFTPRGGVCSLPALPLDKVVDPTGAGDCFAGGLVGSLARGGGKLDMRSLKKAMAYGTVMASFCVSSFSLEGFLKLKRADIERRFGQYREMLRF